jgi:hypothetical protein
MADVTVTEPTRAELLRRKDIIDLHVTHCCRVQDDTCPRLVELDDLQYLLGGQR